MSNGIVVHFERQKSCGNRRLTSFLIILFALWALSVNQSEAAIRIGEQTALLFASVEEGRRILSAEDEYIERMSPFDRSARMKTDREVSRGELLSFIAAQALEWESDEREKIERVLHGIRDGLKRASLRGLGTVHLIKTSGEEEGNAAYTRGRSIVLPRSMVQRPEPFLKRLLAHELFHILSRNHPTARNALYQTIGFRYCGEIEFPPALAPRKITNPDAPRNDYCIRVKVNGEATWVVPILFSTTERYDVGGKKSLFDYMQTALLAIDGGSDRPVRPKKGPEGPLLFDADQATGFFDQVGRNTDYSIHPEEILAENFALLVLGEENVPSPEILSKIKETLARTKDER